MNRGLKCCIAIVLSCLWMWIMIPDVLGEITLVQDGESLAPVVIFDDAPPLTMLAAEELAEYIEKISGARPEVIEGQPSPLPDTAIWVGYQPILDELFPELDFEFDNPEEILISANEKHLVIVGRDIWNPGHMGDDNREQVEYGTHNAVYTFLQDYLDVRWLWPGEELGEDIIEQTTIAFEPFEYRYHPQVRARGALLPYSQLHRAGPDRREAFSGGAFSGYWMRAQRLQLDSLGAAAGHGGGGFGTWWERFHEDHPEYFALQPDGTRSLATSPGNVKMCFSNPDVGEQWLDDVEVKLEENPNQIVFNASPGDSWQRGHCICEDCRAWDHPDGDLRRYSWSGLSQTYVALSDRDVTFANKVARGLKERFPDQQLYVYMYAYGNSRPAPVEAVPDDNVIIGNVANFLLRSDLPDRGSLDGKTHREQFADWGKVTKNHFWRPNTGNPVGWQTGFPDVPLQRTIDDLKFAAENGWMGIYIDYVREFWSTQGPMYYLMAQLTWNPQQDAQEILNDYYQRAFGPAAEVMEEYWTYMEELREECYGTERPGYSDHDLIEFYNEQRLDQAVALLDQAEEKAADGPEIYRRRIEFVRVGLDFTRLLTECGRLMKSVNDGEDEDGSKREKVLENWEEIRGLQQEYPSAMRWRNIFGGFDGTGPPAMGSAYYPVDN